MLAVAALPPVAPVAALPPVAPVAAHELVAVYTCMPKPCRGCLPRQGLGTLVYKNGCLRN